MTDATRPVIVLGSGGMLGRAWCELLQGRGAHFVGFRHAELDIGKREALTQLTTASLIVNCAAYTKVDAAEENRDEAALVNATAPGWIAEQAHALGAALIHYSTDYVFNGSAQQPYVETAKIAPINTYGRTKAEGEQAVQRTLEAALIIRSSWLYAPWGSNFVNTISRLLRNKPELRVVADQHGRPSSVEQLAARSLALFEAGATGIYHLADAGECSWFEFATAIRDDLGLDTPVHPIPTSEYPTPARRPAYSVLDTTSAERLIGPAIHWRRELSRVLGRPGADG